MIKILGLMLYPKPTGSASLAAIVSAFVPTWVTACLFVVAFVVVRQRYPKIYSPRTFIGTVPEKYVDDCRGDM
jgi:calcium permeable stress-gated cation channel